MRVFVSFACVLLIAACGSDEASRPDAVALPPPDAGPDGAPVDAPDTSLCSVALECPSAEPNKVSICGRIFDVQTSQPVGAVEPAESCETATGGACDLELRAYDALDFAGDPNGATPLPYESLTTDTCGRFALVNVNRPSLGFLGLAVDDEAGADDLHRLTGVAFPVVSAEVRNGLNAQVVRVTTDQGWTDTAGLTGDTFVDRGVLGVLFLKDGVPVEGVRVTEAGAVEAANDYYLSDTDPTQRTTVDAALDATGPNGFALKLNSGLSEHSGTGGESYGCLWESALAAAIPGVLFFAPRRCE